VDNDFRIRCECGYAIKPRLDVEENFCQGYNCDASFVLKDAVWVNNDKGSVHFGTAAKTYTNELNSRCADCTNNSGIDSFSWHNYTGRELCNVCYETRMRDQDAKILSRNH
jgi:hypothetical protein